MLKTLGRVCHKVFNESSFKSYSNMVVFVFSGPSCIVVLLHILLLFAETISIQIIMTVDKSVYCNIQGLGVPGCISRLIYTSCVNIVRLDCLNMQV